MWSSTSKISSKEAQLQSQTIAPSSSASFFDKEWSLSCCPFREIAEVNTFGVIRVTQAMKHLVKQTRWTRRFWDFHLPCTDLPLDAIIIINCFLGVDQDIRRPFHFQESLRAFLFIINRIWVAALSRCHRPPHVLAPLTWARTRWASSPWADIVKSFGKCANALHYIP